MSKSIVFLVGFIALNWWGLAAACSCWPGTTLAQHYERANNILVAKITGCAPDRLSSDGNCGGHGWTFETVEDLKGSNAALRVERMDSSGARSTCDLSFQVGDTYVLFLVDGRAYQCSGTGALTGPAGERKMREVEVLRAYRDGTIKRLTDPWYFTDIEGECVIGHQVEGAYLSFGYRYARRSTARQGTLPKPTPRLALRLQGANDFAGPTSIQVNGDSVTLTRNTVEIPQRGPFSLDVVEGDAALSLLDRMIQPTEVVISGTRVLRHGDRVPESFRTTTDTTLLADSAAKYKACIAAHSGVNDGNK